MTRQVHEAILVGENQSSILNNMLEYTRCYLPKLGVQNSLPTGAPRNKGEKCYDRRDWRPEKVPPEVLKPEKRKLKSTRDESEVRTAEETWRTKRRKVDSQKIKKNKNMTINEMIKKLQSLKQEHNLAQFCFKNKEPVFKTPSGIPRSRRKSKFDSWHQGPQKNIVKIVLTS